MDILQKIAMYSDYIGVAIGLLMLIISSIFLPSRIRAHVLTAGLTLIAFRTFQIYSNKRKLKAADEEREKLRDQHRELQKRLAERQHETENLRSRKVEIEQELKVVRQEKKALKKDTVADKKAKKELDQRAKKLLNESEEVVAQRNSQLEALRAIAAFNRKLVLLQ
jgi:chromosome segregation ATPase